MSYVVLSAEWLDFAERVYPTFIPASADVIIKLKQQAIKAGDDVGLGKDDFESTLWLVKAGADVNGIDHDALFTIVEEDGEKIIRLTGDREIYNRIMASHLRRPLDDLIISA